MMRRVAILLLACGAGSAVVAGPALAQTQTGTLKTIAETRSITLGVRDSAVPFSYLDEQQRPVGFAIDICLAVVDAIKTELALPTLEIRMQTVTSSTRIPLLTNGTIDLECGSTTNNPERQKQVTFSNTYFLTASKFAARKTAGLTTIDSLRGRAVASTSGTVNIAQLNRVNTDRGLGLTILPGKDYAETFLLLETGRAQALVLDDVLLASLIASSKEPGAYAIGDDAFGQPEPYSIMIRRDDAPFKAVVDRATAALLSGPAGMALYTKWFMSPIPPRGLTLGLPMTPALARAFAAPSDDPDPAHYTR